VGAIVTKQSFKVQQKLWTSTLSEALAGCGITLDWIGRSFHRVGKGRHVVGQTCALADYGYAIYALLSFQVSILLLTQNQKSLAHPLPTMLSAHNQFES